MKNLIFLTLCSFGSYFPSSSAFHREHIGPMLFSNGVMAEYLQTGSMVDDLQLYKVGLSDSAMVDLYTVGLDSYAEMCSTLIWWLKFSDANDPFYNSLGDECGGSNPYPPILGSHRYYLL